MEAGVADAKRRAAGQGHGFPERALAPRHHAAPDVIRARAEQLRHALANVVRRDLRVAVDPDDDLAAGPAQGRIQPGRHDAAGIVDAMKIRVAGGEFFDDVARAVGGTAVGHDDLEPLSWVVLGENGSQAASDELHFLANRHDDRDRREIAHWAHSDAAWPSLRRCAPDEKDRSRRLTTRIRRRRQVTFYISESGAAVCVSASSTS